MTINNTWAYNMHDHDYKSAQSLIQGLVEVASRGGNFLSQCGAAARRPDPAGVSGSVAGIGIGSP